MTTTENNENAPADETSAAVLTSTGRGAVAVIQLRGDWGVVERQTPALFHAANGRAVREQENGRLIYGRWGRTAPEDVVVCRVDEGTLEIHCHGGRAAPQRILNDLAEAGVAVPSDRDQFTAHTGRLYTECWTTLSRTRTLRTAEIALEQFNGRLKQRLDELGRLAEQRSERLADEIDGLLRWAEFGRRLRRPWRVVVCGRPNVGKSSLINALVGFERSIVFDQPGTTRDVVTSETALDGWPVEFVDTAGIRDAPEEVESAGVERARSAIRTADLCLLLLDVGRPLTPEDRELLQTVRSGVVVLHKCDLPTVWSPADEPPFANRSLLAVSSLAEVGLTELQRRIVESLVPEVPPPDAAIPVADRQVKLLEDGRGFALAGDFAAAASVLREIG